MFTVEDRESLRSALVAAARSDARIDAAATLGSAAIGRTDGLSDIDLALGIAPGDEVEEVLEDWTRAMYELHGAVHHFDVVAGAVYRVFLLHSTLQVDLSFWAPGDLRALGPAFSLLFGEPGEPRASVPPDRAELVGLAWLHLLHARSSIARGRVWQAEQMLAAARARVLALACARLGLRAHQGRDDDELPAELLARAAGSLVGTLETDVLWRALAVLVELLVEEAGQLDSALASRLAPVLGELASSRPRPRLRPRPLPLPLPLPLPQV
jgi:hypothetical protein